ncbi:MAG: DUF3108 domain-containing protein [Ignavibacteriales bacterium]|nr:DUF3108 domain-containing protein [Ignavibacteriales bacterium]
MRRRTDTIFVIIILVCVEYLRAQNPPADTSAPRTEFRTVPHKAFSVGERLVFDVGYSFITAGEAVFSISRSDSLRGREVQQVMFTVVSTPTFSWIFKVDDKYETWVDAKGVFPWKFSQRVREGSYSRDFEAELDQIRHVAVTKDGKYPIPEYVHDIVSAFYFTRTFDFSQMMPGQKTYLENFYKDTTYSLAIKFLGFQRLKVDAGTFDCVVVEPLIKEGGLFKSEGRILIWLTNDERRIPVKVSTKVVVGSIDAELREYSGINGPITAKVK